MGSRSAIRPGWRARSWRRPRHGDIGDLDKVPFPLDAARRDQVRATAQEIALVRPHHFVRRYFEGVDLLALSKTMRSMAGLVFEVERHEVLSGIDESEYLADIDRNRATSGKARRLTAADRRDDEEAE